MGKAIQEIESQNGNGTYNIVLGNDYRIYCTCKAWQYSRPPIKECKHLRELFDVDVIKRGNYYKYDMSLSNARFWSRLISFS